MLTVRTGPAISLAVGAPWPRPVHWVAPPPPRVVVAPRLRPGWVWTPGYWRWTGRAYVWIDGVWLAERPGYGYVAAHWVRGVQGWVFVPGGWARRPY
ncbi:MAG TPA: hypothetical protein VGM26_00295 [Rhizomicrobium sp.]